MKLQRMGIRVLISNYSKIKGLLKENMICFDDFVFAIYTKGEFRHFHLDFEKFGYYIESENNENDEAVLYVDLKSLGTNWDVLNKEEGIPTECITTDLVLKSDLDNYVIFFSDKDGNKFYDFKIIAAAIKVDKEMKELDIPDNAYNSAEEVSCCIK